MKLKSELARASMTSYISINDCLYKKGLSIQSNLTAQIEHEQDKNYLRIEGPSWP
jgi:hypothetical protein